VLYDIEKYIDAKRSQSFLKKVALNQVLGITSTLTWDEFVWVVKKTLGRNIAIEKGKEFLNFPNLHFEKVNLNIINRAQDLISKYNIRPRDAIHSACALENDVKKIISYDEDFDLISELERIEPELS
jgi:predicted nucleic acid-binding protein